MELDRPGARGIHFRHANSTRRGTRCARARPSRGRQSRRRLGRRGGGERYASSAFWKQRPASRRSSSAPPCAERAVPVPLADALPLSLPQKGKMAQTPTFKLILVGDGGTGACARLPRASEASRSAAERLVFKI